MEKIAIEAKPNDLKHNQKIIKFFKKIYPNLKTNGFSGDCVSLNFYYYVDNNYLRYYHAKDLCSQNYELLTLKEAEELYEESLIPEKWCIRGSREAEEFQLNELMDRTNVSFKYDNYYYYTDSSNFIYWRHDVSLDGRKEITFQQFYNHIYLPTIKKEENMSGKTSTIEKMYPVTRQQMKQIHDIACQYWKLIIIDIVKNAFDEFSEESELREGFVKEMFDAATKGQLSILKKIFPDYETELTLKELSNGLPLAQFGIYTPVKQMITNRNSGKYGNKAFCLNPNFNWEIIIDKDDIPCLIPTKK